MDLERSKIMVLSFTEEQKREIEAKGMKVVQVKLFLYKLAKALQPIFDNMWNICKNMLKDQINLIKECEGDE